MLLALYIFSLIVGGAFVLMAVFSGGGEEGADKPELETVGEVEGVPALHGEVGKDLETRSRRRYNPLMSFKFYTFFLGFFGLTGAVLTVLGLWSSAPGVLALSVAMGLLAGISVSWGLWAADSGRGHEGITARDYYGSLATVVLPVGSGRRGKVRMRIKGRLVELLAESDNPEVVLDMDQECFVLSVEEGVARVADARELEGTDARRS